MTSETAVPLSAATVSLALRDLPGTAGFYRRLLGLEPLVGEALAGPEGWLTLGAAGRPLLHLRASSEAQPQGGHEPGLFHTAFLLPGRADLANWLHHAAALGVPLQGASDHGVSEAIYLADPEGNGIEVYADRPRAEWPVPADGQPIGMFTRRLDLPGLMATAPRPGALPEAVRIGHVHLRTNAVPEAVAFYTALGLQVTQRMPQAAFLSTAGYHHHLAVNSWASAGAARRPAGLAGLLEVELRAGDATSFDRAAGALHRAGAVLEEAPGLLRAEDPAGNGLRLSLG